MTNHDSPGRLALVPLSYLRHREVVDARDRSAPLLDLAVDLRDGDYPKVGRLLIGLRKAPRELAASRLRLSESGLDLRIDDLATAAPVAVEKRPRDILLIHDLLDSLIIDLQRRGAEGGAQVDPGRGEGSARRDTLTSAPPTAGAAPLPPKVPSTARSDCGKESGRRRRAGDVTAWEN